jgi:hypothetical protein
MRYQITINSQDKGLPKVEITGDLLPTDMRHIELALLNGLRDLNYERKKKRGPITLTRENPEIKQGNENDTGKASGTGSKD